MEDATNVLGRTLGHVFRDAESLIRESSKPLAVKVRKNAGLELRREKINEAINELLGAFYDVWEALENDADHERETVKKFRDARSKGAAVKLARDPTQLMKMAIKVEWKAWQSDRGLFRYPRDFRREMLLKYPDAVDGTLKNWMSGWGREK